MKRYICNKEFKMFGLEEGDYFPIERISEEHLKQLLKRNHVILTDE